MATRSSLPTGRRLPALVLFAALAVCGCSEREAPQDNATDNPPAAAKPTPPPKKKPAPSAEKRKAPKLPDAPSVSSDQQMLDDADATGLTATLPPADDLSGGEASNAQ